MAKVFASRDDEIHIVEHEGKYYLINLMLKTVEKADPQNIPDQFLKFGYFEGPYGNKIVRDNAEATLLLWLDKQEAK
jgi:hypothetical protein